MARTETVLIAGAGIAGLGAAMALAGPGRSILLLERDPPPPVLDARQSFDGWQRSGAAQTRHSHVFLGRLTAHLRRHYPALLEELLAAGARLCPFEEMLPEQLRRRYRPVPGDEDLTLLQCRRATFEYVLRRYVERLDGVEVIANAQVTGLLADGTSIRGLQYQSADRRAQLTGDVTIDASGRTSRFPNWLRSLGVVIEEQNVPAGILYFTRHYRLRPGARWPELNRTSLGGDLGHLRYGICPADNDCFSITLAVPQHQSRLRHLVRKEEDFQALCENIPACAVWTDAERASPHGPVLAMGGLVNVWRSYLKDGKAQAPGFFAIGDAAVRTNPLDGRGCSAGLLQAHLLRHVFEETADPAQRAVLLEQRTAALLRPYFDHTIGQDRKAPPDGEDGQKSAAADLKSRLKQSLVERGLQPALVRDIHVARAFARTYHMIDPPIIWRRRPALLARILRSWLMPIPPALQRKPPAGAKSLRQLS